MSHTWDPAQYLRFEDARARPFFDLVARIPERVEVRRVLDLGCGPGNMTLRLLDRFPKAKVTGIDRSKEMVREARSLALPGRLDFEVADLSLFAPQEPVQVIISNATLQWVPGHLNLFGRFVSWLDPGGTFAFQVPNMHDEPSHALLRELSSTAKWQDRFDGMHSADGTRTASTYLEALMELGCDVEVWETIYLQLLGGDDPVLEWARGTSLRPYLARLSATEADEFAAIYGASLRKAYPPGPFGTVYPFRRLFVIATRRN